MGLSDAGCVSQIRQNLSPRRANTILAGGNQVGSLIANHSVYYLQYQTSTISSHGCSVYRTDILFPIGYCLFRSVSISSGQVLFFPDGCRTSEGVSQV
jgi:hypothetical protein